MVSESTALSRLKRLAKELPDEGEAFNMLRSLEGENTHASDRAAAIVGATLIENALEAVILSRLSPFLNKDDRRELFDGDKNAPIATFSARIRIGYSLDVYGKKTREQLDRIRAVRNAFAHSGRHLTFATKEVADVVDGLVAYQGKSLSGDGPIKTSKERYITNVAYLAECLKLLIVPTSSLSRYLMRSEHHLP